MLKIQELQVDGRTFKVREPRLRDFLEAKKASAEDYTYSLMGQMILDENGVAIGIEAVYDLPLRMFEPLQKAVESLTVSQAPAPLDQSDGSSTA